MMKALIGMVPRRMRVRDQDELKAMVVEAIAETRERTIEPRG